MIVYNLKMPVEIVHVSHVWIRATWNGFDCFENKNEKCVGRRNYVEVKKKKKEKKVF